MDANKLVGLQIGEVLDPDNWTESPSSIFENYLEEIQTPEFQERMRELDAERFRTQSLLSRQIVGQEDPRIFR